MQGKMQGLVKMKLGEVSRSKFIKRCDVAVGTKGRAILLTESVVCCSIVYTKDPVRGTYYADYKTALEYGLFPHNYYIIPIARLNTNAAGVVTDATIGLEYLKLSESVYTSFASDYEELERCETLVLEKEDKGEYSYVKVKPSSKDVIPPEYKKKIMDMVSSYDEDTLFVYALMDCANPFEVYIKTLKDKGLDAPKTSLSGLFPAKGGAGKVAEKEVQGKALPENAQDVKQEKEILGDRKEDMGGRNVPGILEDDKSVGFDEFDEFDDFGV